LAPNNSRVQAPDRRLSTIAELDENAMRRGTVVDDGVIISPIDEKSPMESALKGSPSINTSKEKKAQ
jgi:hypothetical protein